MTGQFVDIVLSISLHAFSFGNDIPYIFMILFQLTLLTGRVWIAVEDIAAPLARSILFNVPRVFKLRAIICENNFKVLPK